MRIENGEKIQTRVDMNELPVNQIKTAMKCMKYFKPVGDMTNPMWLLCSSYLTRYYMKTKAFQEYLPTIEKRRKNIPMTAKEVYKDIAYSMFAFGAEPDQYFDFNFYRLTNRGRDKFLTSIKNYEFLWKMNDITHSEKLNNKALVAEKFSKWYKREWTLLKEEEDIAVCVDFLEKHGECVIKPLTGALGNGVQLVNNKELKDPSEFFRARLNEGSWIFEEKIHQHPVLAAIHPSSVNTIRIHTVLSKKGEVKIFCPYMRMGKGGSVMDNYSAGGYEALVDAETGIIFGSLFPFEKKPIIAHPDTGTRVIGMRLPEWDKAREMAKELAHVYSEFRYIGWDFAYSEDKGWMIVEGNLQPGEGAYQKILGIGKLADLYEMLKWSDEN